MKTSLVLLAGVTALAPLAGAAMVVPAAAASSTGFAPPTAPMTLSRTVIRELPDGKQIIVKRSFRIQFVNAGSGYTLNGAPIGVTVDVPPVLERMADLERQRSEPGPFPLVVDNRGIIHNPTASEVPDQQARDRARAMGSSLLQAAPIAQQTKVETIQFLDKMVSDPRSAPWPVDLFSAKDAERHLHRSVALADGSQGEVDVVLRVAKWLPCGMPAQFERVITTDLSGTRRISREVWSLEPIAGN